VRCRYSPLVTGAPLRKLDTPPSYLQRLDRRTMRARPSTATPRCSLCTRRRRETDLIWVITERSRPRVRRGQVRQHHHPAGFYKNHRQGTAAAIILAPLFQVIPHVHQRDSRDLPAPRAMKTIDFVSMCEIGGTVGDHRANALCRRRSAQALGN